jgi:hypothetical protein
MLYVRVVARSLVCLPNRELGCRASLFEVAARVRTATTSLLLLWYQERSANPRRHR